MKYHLIAFSFKNPFDSDEVIVGVKGALFYKLQNGGVKFIFPWNVYKLSFKSIEVLPIKFYGFKGVEIVCKENLLSNVFRWEPDHFWNRVTYSQLHDYKSEILSATFEKDIPKKIAAFDKIQDLRINYVSPKIPTKSLGTIIPTKIITTKYL